MALFQNFFRNIEAINPFDREDEEERKQALKFKELEKTLKQCKATMLKKSIDEKLDLD